MKKTLIALSLLIFATSALAKLSHHGPYLGAQTGYTNTDNSHAPDKWGTYRIFGGWRFNDYLALEGGYNSILDKSDAKINGYDLTGKIILPLILGFHAYVLGGGQYVKQDIKNDSYDSNSSALLPVIGIGGGWNLTNGIAVDASWRHTIGVNNIKNIDFIALGVSYTL
ncbi:MAG: porin family protein [Gammaproteobacteria bacterium]|nr:porin family protein [Gammaproteobacteria bacterium]